MSESYVRKEVIGDCTLYLGDCINLIPEISGVGAVVSDPPYGMSFRSNYRKDRYEEIANDSGLIHLLAACKIPAAHSKYIFCRWDNLLDVPKPKSLVTWVKNNWSMGDLDHEHARQTEVALFYPGPDHDFPSGRPTDVIQAPRTGNEFHPTEKPVQLMAAIIRWTRGLVFDPFMGSGTTGVACARGGAPVCRNRDRRGLFRNGMRSDSQSLCTAGHVRATGSKAYEIRPVRIAGRR